MAFWLMADLAKRFGRAEPEQPSDAFVRWCVDYVRAHQWIELRAKHYDDERRTPESAARLAIVQSIAAESTSSQPEMTSEQLAIHQALRSIVERRQYDRLRYLMPVALGGGDHPKSVPELLRQHYIPKFNKTSEVVKACEWCGCDFYPKQPRRFCMRKCGAAARQERRRRKEPKARAAKGRGKTARTPKHDALGRGAVSLEPEWAPPADEEISVEAIQDAMLPLVRQAGPEAVFEALVTDFEEKGQLAKARVVASIARDLRRDTVTVSRKPQSF